MGGELDRASPGEEGATPPDPSRRDAMGRRIVAEALDAEAAAALAAGGRPPTSEGVALGVRRLPPATRG
jgi:hypothetical protein